MIRLGFIALLVSFSTLHAASHSVTVKRAQRARAPALQDYSQVTTYTDDQLKAIKIEPDNMKPFAPKKESTGFVVGGKNDSKLIATLPTINGVKLAELEKSMRPGALSDGGFLGKEEKLLDVLAKDNDWVLKSKLTHQEIAKHLRALTELGRAPGADTGFTYQGRRFKVLRFDTKGFQVSPFKDGTSDGRNATIVNLDTGKKTTLAMLLVPMIEQYGFYEGEKSPYRTSPQEVVGVLDFLMPGKR